MSDDVEVEALRQWTCPDCGGSNLTQSGKKRVCSNCGYEP